MEIIKKMIINQEFLSSRDANTLVLAKTVIKEARHTINNGTHLCELLDKTYLTVEGCCETCVFSTKDGDFGGYECNIDPDLLKGKGIQHLLTNLVNRIEGILKERLDDGA